MGDRSNIKVVFPDGEAIYLYGHWMGSDNYRIVEEAINEGRRLHDPAYFTRILFSKMLKDGDPQLDGETGFGISTRVEDNGHPIAVVDYTRIKDGRFSFYMDGDY